MAGTSGASTVVSEENESEKLNSVDDTVEEANKRMKCEQKDDFISALPDCLIQHILSFLPSSKDAIRTGVLSKRWVYQWTRVPILIFKSTNGMSIENFSNFVDNALNLYNCSKIDKFVINSNDYFLIELRRKLSKWIRFAASRDVKELILNCDADIFEAHDDYQLPRFLYKNAFLVKLKTECCVFMPKKGKVNWSSLKALYIGFANLPNQAVENVLSGSPVIEYLELCSCYGFEGLVIASKSLKTFRMSGSDCCSAIEISCANLQKLVLLGQMSFTCLKLKDLPPSVCATLDFETGDWRCSVDDKLKWVQEFLLQVQHVEELKIGPWFLMMLSLAAVRGGSSLSLNNKCLTVIDPFFVGRQPGIAILLVSCSLLEKLVIQLCGGESFQIEGFVMVEKKFWELDASVFECLVSHLKTVEIVGLHYISSNGVHEDVLKFLEFLLKNARVLEKMVLLEARGQGMIFARDVCRKLSCIQKASSRAIFKVECLSMVDLHSDFDWDKIAC